MDAKQDATPTSGPLAGIRVLDLTRVASGPFSTMLLGDLGADVLKVERPGTGDDSRHMDISFRGGASGYYIGLNKNKRSVAIDLKDPSGVALVHRLAAWADVVVENFRVGVADRLGVGYSEMRVLNPELVYCSISGFGPESSDPSEPIYDIVGQAVSGVMHITGDPNGPPAKCGAPIADLTAGVFATAGIIAALYHRERTGEGQKIEVPLVGATLNLLASYLPGRALGTPFERVGSAHNTLAPYQAFRGSDDEYFIVGVANDDFWRRLVALLGLEELGSDPRFATNAERTRRRDELAVLLQQRFGERPSGEWIAALRAANIPTSQVYDLDDVLAEPSYRANGFIVDVEQASGESVPVVMGPWLFSETPVSLRLPPPALDEHGDDVLSDSMFAPRSRE